MHEPLQQLFNASGLMILDFSQIPADTPPTSNIKLFFTDSQARGINPRLPENRQHFNNRMLAATGARYLVSRYGEDRRAMLAGSVIAKEGRTLHMGVDIFSKNLETVYTPCNGQIVQIGHEPDDHSFGYYAILKPEDFEGVYFFFGHLSSKQSTLGAVIAGQPFATLGDYPGHENGGWSRHLHLQILTNLPPSNKAPIGYSSTADFLTNSTLYPDPMPYFPNWKLN